MRRSTFVAFGFVIDDVDVFLAKGLDQAIANVADLNDERKLVPNGFEYEVKIAAVEPRRNNRRLPSH
jgi:hypothetical protein